MSNLHNASLNKDPVMNSKDYLIGDMPSSAFNLLNDGQKEIYLAGYNDIQNKEKEGGLVGRVIGTSTENATINTASVLIFLLLIYCILDMICAYWRCKPFNYESFKIVLPVVTLALGYIFGKK